jgi:hypothetical protein
MMVEIIIKIADIVLTALGLYCAYKLGYRCGMMDAEELFWKEGSEVTK